MAGAIEGVWAPVLTPFTARLVPDAARLVGLCRRLEGEGLGLAPFGTTGEGHGLAVEEKLDLLDALAAAGLDLGRVMPGVGSCCLPDTVRVTAHAVGLGCGAVLALPPFYDKSVGDEGLFRTFSELIERVGDSRLRLVLYHFPRQSGMPITAALIGRLLGRYPGIVAGIKDSSGDFDHALELIRAFPGFPVLSGTAARLREFRIAGGAGCVSGHANLVGAAILALWRGEADGGRVAALRGVLEGLPLVPALKALMAAATGDASWRIHRPPLVDLDPAQAEDLFRRADRAAGGTAPPGTRPPL